MCLLLTTHLNIAADQVCPLRRSPQQDDGTHCNAHTFWDWLEERAKEAKAWTSPPNSSYPKTIEHSFEAREQRPQSKKYHIRPIYYTEGLTSKMFNTYLMLFNNGTEQKSSCSEHILKLPHLMETWCFLYVLFLPSGLFGVGKPKRGKLAAVTGQFTLECPFKSGCLMTVATTISRSPCHRLGNT